MRLPLTALALFTISCCLILSGTRAAQAQVQQPAQAPTQPQQRQPDQLPDLGLKVELEPRALDVLKAMSDRLAASKTMSFTAMSTYESPARTGDPLAYTTLSEVLLQRPDKLRVITPADGPPSEFYYDGTVMMAYSPDKELVAIADAPPTIDAMLKAIYEGAAIYFPFTDVIVADPYKDIADGLKLAFVIGRSRVVGGTTTDMIALANDTLQAQLWIGSDDKLPRMIRATFFNEPGGYRHVVEFSKWQLGPAVSADAFTSSKAKAANRMAFARPPSEPAKQQ